MDNSSQPQSKDPKRLVAAIVVLSATIGAFVWAANRPKHPGDLW